MKFNLIIDDVTSWWVQKCAAAVQDCFIDGVGELKTLPASLARQFSVDYGMLNILKCFFSVFLNSAPGDTYFCVCEC